MSLEIFVLTRGSLETWVSFQIAAVVSFRTVSLTPFVLYRLVVILPLGGVVVGGRGVQVAVLPLLANAMLLPPAVVYVVSLGVKTPFPLVQ